MPARSPPAAPLGRAVDHEARHAIQLDAQIRAPEVWSRYGLTGAGVRVGTIDTGADASNPELAGAIAGWRDFVNAQPVPYDDNGHGTHTVGTMVARNVAGVPMLSMMGYDPVTLDALIERTGAPAEIRFPGPAVQVSQGPAPPARS